MIKYRYQIINSINLRNMIKRNHMTLFLFLILLFFMFSNIKQKNNKPAFQFVSFLDSISLKRKAAQLNPYTSDYLITGIIRKGKNSSMNLLYNTGYNLPVLLFKPPEKYKKPYFNCNHSEFSSHTRQNILTPSILY